MNSLSLIPFLIYFIVLIAIGVYAQKFSSGGMREFFIGNRKMNKLVVAISAIASGRNSWLLLGFTGQVYMIGLSAVWAVAGYILVECLLFLYYAPRIRDLAGKNDCITIPDFYASNFKDDKGYLRLLLIFIFIIFMVSSVSAQFVHSGKAFYANFGLNQTTGIILTAMIVLFYTFMGGFLAVNLTDVFQIIIMLISLIILPLYTLYDIGGIHEVGQRIQNLDQNFFNPFALSLGVMIGFISIGLGSPGNPHIIIRYMSIKDPSKFRWIAIMGTACNLLLVLGVLLIGILARAYFPNIESLPGKDPENAFLTLSKAVLPPVFVGLIVASIFASLMSTADSQLLVVASSLVRDFYEKILNKRKKIQQAKLVYLSRIALILLVYLAIILGLFAEKVIFKFVLFAWTGLASSIGPTLILTLFWKKTSRNGVIAGLITGILTIIIWKSIPALKTAIYELIPAFILAWAVTMLISYIDYRFKKRDNLKRYKFTKVNDISLRFDEGN